MKNDNLEAGKIYLIILIAQIWSTKAMISLPMTPMPHASIVQADVSRNSTFTTTFSEWTCWPRSSPHGIYYDASRTYKATRGAVQMTDPPGPCFRRSQPN